MKAAPPGPSYRRYLAAVLTLAAALLWLTWTELQAVAPGHGLGYLLHPSVADVTRLYGNLTRTTIQLMMLFTTATAIAVPLTANLYTPRLIDLFVRDKVNRAFLALMLFSAILVHFSLFVVRDQPDLRFAPPVLLSVTALMGFTCLVLAAPYVYHIFDFLRPTVIVRRMQLDVRARVARAQREDSPALRAAIAGMISQIGEVAMRAANRSDAALAATVITELEHLAAEYARLKPEMPKSWFDGDPNPILTLPVAARARLQHDCCWFEFHLLRTIDSVLPAAMSATPDLMVPVGHLLRTMAEIAVARADEPILRMVFKFLNTYLHRTIIGQHAKAFYDLSYETRRLGEELLPHAAPWAPRVGETLGWYARQAHESASGFARDVALYDLVDLAIEATETASPHGPALVGSLLKAYEALPARLEPAIQLLGFALRAQDTDLADRLEALLADRPTDAVASAVETVLAAVDPEYREVTGRVVDMNYVPDAEREKLGEWWARRREG